MAKLRVVAVVLAFIVAGTLSASAQQLAQIYISSEGSAEALQQLNFSTGELSTIYSIGAKADDMMLNSAGDLIYTVPNLGEVNLYNPTTGTNTILCDNIPSARDLAISLDGTTLYIAQYADPADIYEYSLANGGACTVFYPKNKTIKTFDGIAFDPYGNFYAVASHNTIVQINVATQTIVNTLTIEAHNGINGGDGLTYDSYTGCLWATVDGKVLGTGLIQIPVQASGFVSTTPGFTFYPLPGIVNVDGIKSDGLGNLYVGAIWSALAYNIPTHSIVANVTVKGADGVSPIPGTYGAKKQLP